MRVACLLPLLAGLGCQAAQPREIVWHDDLGAALRLASAADRPLLVVSIVGDLRKRC